MGFSDSWRATIESLSAGYRFLGRRVELILIPVLLDIWLWFAPKLSITPLVENFVQFTEEAVGQEELPSMYTMITPDALLDIYGSVNLMDSLVSGSLLHVPSLVVAIGLEIAHDEVEITNPFVAFGLFTGLSIIGLLIGVFYMNLLARQLPLGSGVKPSSFGVFIKQVFRHWMMVIVLIVALIATMFAIAIPISMGVFFLGLFVPMLGTIFGSMVVMASVFLTFGLIITFYFVTAAIVLDDLSPHRAFLQSILVVRNNALASLMFIAMSWLISVGFTMFFVQLAQLSTYSLVLSVPVYAYIGSGLVLALFVFYRTSILRLSAQREEAIVQGHRDDV